MIMTSDMQTNFNPSTGMPSVWQKTLSNLSNKFLNNQADILMGGLKEVINKLQKSNQLLEKNNDDLANKMSCVMKENVVLKERNMQLEKDINTIYETIKKSSSFVPQQIQKKKEVPKINMSNNGANSKEKESAETSNNEIETEINDETQEKTPENVQRTSSQDETTQSLEQNSPFDVQSSDLNNSELRTSSDGVKQFQCLMCDRSYTKKGSLTQHMRVHDSSRAFTCNICHKKFPTKRRFDEHYRIHSGEKPYVCTHCGRGFTQSGSLRRHIQAVHPNEVSNNDTNNYDVTNISDIPISQLGFSINSPPSMVVTSQMRNDVMKRNSDVMFPNLGFSDNSLPSMVVSSNKEKSPKQAHNINNSMNERNDIDLFGGFSDLKPPVIVAAPIQRENPNDHISSNAAKSSDGM